MKKPIKILLQTTIPYTEDDWHIGRFSLLRDHLMSLKSDDGEKLYEVTARDIEKDKNGNDKILSRLYETDFDELWLFAVDAGDGLTTNDCLGITKFYQRGGGTLLTRDHEDLGSSLCKIEGLGAAHYFHSSQPDSDATRNSRDDQATSAIDYPNYHSGSNGNYQIIKAAGEPHELLKKTDGKTIQYFPSHPHEGGIGVPAGVNAARVIATGTSEITGRQFNLIVAFDRGDKDVSQNGRGIAESSFHHLLDYNWNTDKGCPTFVEEAPGDGYRKNPQALEDIKTYVANVAKWLAPVNF